LSFYVSICIDNVTGSQNSYVDLTWSIWKSRGFWCRLENGCPVFMLTHNDLTTKKWFWNVQLLASVYFCRFSSLPWSQVSC